MSTISFSDVRDVGLYAEGEVAPAVVVPDAEFPAGVAHLAGVLVGGVQTHAGRNVEFHQDVVGVLAVPVGRDVEFREERDVDAHVEHRRGLPLDVGVGQRVERYERRRRAVHRNMPQREAPSTFSPVSFQ